MERQLEEEDNRKIKKEMEKERNVVHNKKKR
jgi:hypothetical protein